MSLDWAFWRRVAADVVADGAIDAGDAARVLRAVSEALRLGAREGMPLWRRIGIVAGASLLDELADALEQWAREVAADLSAELREGADDRS